jgi:hypothetical protein
MRAYTSRPAVFTNPWLTNGSNAPASIGSFSRDASLVVGARRIIGRNLLNSFQAPDFSGAPQLRHHQRHEPV